MSNEETWLNINLRSIKNTSPGKRTKKAIRLLRYKVAKATKSKLDDIKISTTLNNWLWKRGKNLTYSHLKVRISKDNDKLTINIPNEPSQVNVEKEKPKAESKEISDENEETNTSNS
jgi:ribosomal protein L31E